MIYEFTLELWLPDSFCTGTADIGGSFFMPDFQSRTGSNFRSRSHRRQKIISGSQITAGAPEGLEITGRSAHHRKIRRTESAAITADNTGRSAPPDHRRPETPEDHRRLQKPVTGSHRRTEPPETQRHFTARN